MVKKLCIPFEILVFLNFNNILNVVLRRDIYINILSKMSNWIFRFQFKTQDKTNILTVK